MAYNQGKNPFRSKSPLHHTLADKKSGTVFQHYHDPKNKSRVYSSDQKVITGSDKFGTQSGRAKNLPYAKGGNMNFDVGQRLSEEDIARDYARQMSEMYNTGELVSGSFLADDLYKRNRKLSLKKGKLKLKAGYKGIEGVRDFNAGYADEVEGFDPNVGYVAPETQYTEDQIYDMMVQGGGLVSIVDGQIVSGNPNETMGPGYDRANLINSKDYNHIKYDDQIAYYESGEAAEDYAAREARKNMTQEERFAALKEMRDAKLAKIDEEKALKALKLQERKDILEQKRIKIRAERANELGNSPVNNNSPLHQGQEVDPVSGEPLEGYNYISGDPVINTRRVEILDDDGNIAFYDDITDTQTNFQGNKPAPPPPPPPPDGTPDFKEDCEGIVMNIGADSKSGYYKCDTLPTPPGGTPTEIETPEDDTHSYDTTTTNTVRTPVETPPVETVPEPRKSRFVTGGASIRKGGFDLNLQLQFPDWQDMGDIVRRAKGMIFTRSGRCKSGCATNNPK